MHEILSQVGRFGLFTIRCRHVFDSAVAAITLFSQLLLPNTSDGVLRDERAVDFHVSPNLFAVPHFKSLQVNSVGAPREHRRGLCANCTGRQRAYGVDVSRKCQCTYCYFGIAIYAQICLEAMKAYDSSNNHEKCYLPASPAISGLRSRRSVLVTTTRPTGAFSGRHSNIARHRAVPFSTKTHHPLC